MDEREGSVSAVSARRLTLQYVAGLLLIALIAGIRLYVERRAVNNARGLATIVNLSGRQRMLSQRIAGMAVQFRLGDENARVEMLRIIPVMEESEADLSRPYRMNAEAGSVAEQLHTIYFEGARPLETQAHEFLAVARKVTTLHADDPEMVGLLTILNRGARGSFLDGLDTVVQIHQLDAEQRITDLGKVETFLFGVVLLVLVLEGYLLFRPMVEKISTYAKTLLEMTNTDLLTGVSNRRGVEVRARIEWARAHRYGRALSVLILDVDHFKNVNDTYGHAAGDAVLRWLAACLVEGVRPIDLVGRIGGEEFTVLMPETDLASAAIVAERLRRAVEARETMYEERKIGVTISVGVATINDSSMEFGAVMQVADRLLYEAKKSGRNKVVWQEQSAVVEASAGDSMRTV